MALSECNCGSGLEPFILYDARGIGCGYVCDKCEAEEKSHYRPEIFEDGDYWCDEPFDEEDY